MKVYIGIKYHANLENKNLIENISYALEANKFMTCCIIRDKEKWGEITYSSEMLMEVTFREIDTCDLMVIDLTEKGVGIGIEAGYAFAKGIPIITIAKKGSDISGTLKGISKEIFYYKNFDELVIYFKSIRERFGEEL